MTIHEKFHLCISSFWTFISSKVASIFWKPGKEKIRLEYKLLRFHKKCKKYSPDMNGYIYRFFALSPVFQRGVFLLDSTHHFHGVK